MMNILIRLSPDLVFGANFKGVELLADHAGLAVNDAYDALVSYFEYIWFNGPGSFCEKEFVETYFMGLPMGYDLLYSFIDQFTDIGAYIPDNCKTIRYCRTVGDAFLLLCEVHP